MLKLETMSICSFYITGKNEKLAYNEMEKRIDNINHLPDLKDYNIVLQNLKNEIARKYNVNITFDI